MADADEDAVRGTAVEATQIEVDLSDETQDFRLLNHLNLYVRLELASCESTCLASSLYSSAYKKY